MAELKNRILVVDADKYMGHLLLTVLTFGGYKATLATTGKRAISMTADTQFDLILLELKLFDVDGIRVLRSIREWSDLPIIVVSVQGEEFEKIEALDAGADDYITKPFSNNELLARIRALLRRYRKLSASPPRRETPFSLGGLSVDYERRRVEKNGRVIHLTPIEYKIMVLLSQKAGYVLARDDMLRRIWGDNYVGDGQILRVNVANLRRKIEDNPTEPQYILTEVGIGYRMAAPD